MALFQTTEELRNFIKIGVNTDFDGYLQYIEAAEENYLLPVLGTAQYELLNDAYNDTPPLSAEDEALLKKCRVPVAKFAQLAFITENYGQVGDGGVRVSINQDSERMPLWAFKELQLKTFKDAYQGIDKLYQFLEDNPGVYSDWENSTEYSIHNQYFINTTSAFDALVRIGGSRFTFLKMVPTMENMEALYIEPTIGADFAGDLKAKKIDGTLSPLEKQVYQLICKVVAHYTIAWSITNLTVSIDNGAITMLQFDKDYGNTTKADDTSLSIMGKDHTNLATTFMSKLTTLLDASASDIVLPIYYASTYYHGGDTPAPQINNKLFNGVYSF